MTSPKPVTASELRALFLRFFREREHQIVASSSLVPGNDPTLLFTNAGMVQFKDCFLGKEQRSYTRAASSQRCVRAGGKHNDLENVGYTARHHTFFEMLGNFSFGDYFKRFAIRYAWDFVTGKDWLGIDPKRLMVTVYHTDDEAFDLWHKEIGLPADRIVRIGDKPGGGSDNFWQMGETGPCGPCTEIFYDHGDDIPGGPPGSPDADGDRWIEIWNLVFMQFDRSADGVLSPLPKPSVDTGMGLERVAAVMQGVHSNYEIDLFQGLIAAAAKVTGAADLNSKSLRVIADHIRACSFLIADGVLPSNEGRGYVLRRIIRRAIRYGYKLGCTRPFFHLLVGALEREMGAAYPELKVQRPHIERVLRQEEERFAETLANGMRLFEDEYDFRRRLLWNCALARGRVEELAGGTRLVGGNVSSTWADFGSPSFIGRVIVLQMIRGFNRQAVQETIKDEMDDLPSRASGSAKPWLELVFLRTDELEKEVADWFDSIDRQIFVGRNIQFGARFLTPAEAGELPLAGEVVFRLYDTYGFPVDLTNDIARERGLEIDHAGFETAMDAQRERARAASKFNVDLRGGATIEGQTEFCGYDTLELPAQVKALVKDGSGDVTSAATGETVQIVLDRTPFYAESGGQVADHGWISGQGVRVEVMDVRKAGKSIVHVGKVIDGPLQVGTQVSAAVDADRREAVRLNHSATHLLHAALRKVLGTHVTQKGSLVAPDRLRFDFSHYQGLTADELRAVERLVNAEIRANAPAETKLMGYDAAVASGAMALFGEKYDDEVRVLRIGDFSTELCGGTHVERAGDIGLFKIVSEGGVAAGVRRIEAVTGQGALDWISGTDQVVRDIAALVKAGRDDVEDKVRQLMERSRKLEKELAQAKAKLASGQGSDLSTSAVDVSGVKVVAARLDGADADALRVAVDQLKSKLHSAAIVLASVESDNKVLLIAGVTPDQTSRLKAGDLVNAVAQQIGGRGGGRPELAQAGGTEPAKLDAALASVVPWVQARLS